MKDLRGFIIPYLSKTSMILMLYLCRICTLSSWNYISEKENPSRRDKVINWFVVLVFSVHLCEDSVQPLQGPVQMKLNPARRAGHRLSPVLRPPALHEGHADGAHPGERVDCLEPVVH